MLLRIQGDLLFDVIRRADATALRCRDCGAEVVLAGDPNGLILHRVDCSVLGLVRDVERLKPFKTHVREKGKVKTELFHEAQGRLS